MDRHRALVLGLLVALSLSLGLPSLRPSLDALASEQIDGPKPRPTVQPRPSESGFAEPALRRSAAGAAPSAVRRAAAAQTIVNQSWDGVGELPAGWRTFDDNGATTGGQIYWAIRGAGCPSHSAPNAVSATAGGQNGVLDCQQPYPNVVDSSLIYGPFSLADATSAFLSVDYFVQTEPDYDTLQVKVSLDGGSTFLPISEPLSGPLGGGVLSGNLPNELLGRSSLYLAFVFHSDSSVGVAGGGAFVDDVVLTAELPGGDQPPTATPTRTPTTTPGTTVPDGRRRAIYLPMTIRDRATAPPTPTPPASTCQELISNGGFQQASSDAAAGWSIAGNVHYVTAVDGHATPNIVLFAYGDPSYAGASGDLWQTVAVPAAPTSARLGFWFKSLAGSGTPIKLQVDVLDEGGANVLLHVDTITQGTSDWQQVVRNLSAGQLAPLAGRNVRLRIRIADLTGPLDLFFDDVSWQLCR